MNTPHYLPPDMAPPLPVVAPSKDEDLYFKIHTRMVEAEKVVHVTVEHVEQVLEGE